MRKSLVLISRWQFQSTPPLREATTPQGCGLNNNFISIHASLAGGDGDNEPEDDDDEISIHASLAGGDSLMTDYRRSPRYFNPRLPCGRRHSYCPSSSRTTVFQSTPPLREATGIKLRLHIVIFISIHASLAGGDKAHLHHS